MFCVRDPKFGTLKVNTNVTFVAAVGIVLHKYTCILFFYAEAQEISKVT